MKRSLLMTTATLFLLSAPTLAMAQQPAQPTPAAKPQAQLSQQDRQFVEKAAISDQFEIQAGRVAADKAQNAEVKSFAQRMIDDHGKTSTAMTAMARQKSVQLPAQLDAEHRQKLERLQGLSGGQFDSAYIQGQVEAHQTAVVLFDQQSRQGQDADLKRFAEQTLPALKEHLQHAQGMRPAMASAGNQNQGQGQAGQTSFSNLMGKNVYGEGNNKLGDVADVILDPQSGNATAVILDRGGVMGIGAKQIALDYKLLQLQGDRIVASQITEDQVKAMPEFKYEDTTVSLGQNRDRGTATPK